MVIDLKKDKDGNVIYEEDDDGYYERNTYENGQLVRCEIHYSNGITEVEHYNIRRG